MVARKTYIAAIILIALIATSAYAIYMLSVPQESVFTGSTTQETPTGEGEQEQTIPIVDGTGRNITVHLPIERVVSLNPGLTELLYALGCGDKIVGRDVNSIFPPQVLDKPVVGSSSYDPNVELLLELHPDLVLADDMLSFNQEVLGRIEEAGIPVIMENISNVTRVKAVIT
ncbi:ABC transporter substrate-binding protein, partial [Candidatus Bathyarchaeota archaeon]|nr:ABC transporter substrate-binding protein [Candidatus Bathyarchaeota archaeon]